MTNKDYYFFYATSHPFSQWYKTEFVIDGIVFNCAEQYMMYQKALLFKDKIVAEQVLRTSNQKKQKELGRQVMNFDNIIWEQKREHIVYKANYEKFNQNDELKVFILSTGNKTLVEASPYDTIWGIGIGEDNEDRFYPKRWKGLNLLGMILMSVREELSTKLNTENLLLY